MVSGTLEDFTRDADVVKVVLIQQRDMPKGALHQRLRRDAWPYLASRRLFQAAAVDADADGDAAISGRRRPQP